MALPGRHVTQFTALQFAGIGLLGLMFSIQMSDLGWLALVVGLACAAMFVISVITLVRNHRAGRTL